MKLFIGFGCFDFRNHIPALFYQGRLKIFILFLLILICNFSFNVHAQTGQPLASQQAIIFHEVASVFKDPDFDSKILAEVAFGDVFTISVKKFGPFYRIRLKDGRLGYIADNEVRIGSKWIQRIKSIQEKEKAKPDIAGKIDKNRAIGKSLLKSRYRGPAFELVQFTEETMGKTRTQSLGFFGMKFSGFNTMFDEFVYTDANLLFYSGAPAYYQEATRNSASGYIVLANFQVETPRSISTNMLWFYGMGLGLRMSHFEVALNQGSTVNYVLDDITAGLNLNLGIAVKIGQQSLRTDLKYYWDKKLYPALGLCYGFSF